MKVSKKTRIDFDNVSEQESDATGDAEVNRVVYFTLTGKVSNVAWKGFAAGRMLFMGTSGRSLVRNDRKITFCFCRQPEQDRLTVGYILYISDCNVRLGNINNMVEGL